MMGGSLQSDGGKVLIAPSMMCADQTRLAEEIVSLDESGADLFHFDIMDGGFVPNLALGPVFIESLRRHSRKPFMAHLMIGNPLPFVEPTAEAGADIIVFHLEAVGDPAETADAIRSAGAISGLGLRPETDPSDLFPFLERVALITVLSVPPGFAGGPFLPESVDRVGAVRRECVERNLDIRIVVDGHIDETTIGPLTAAGGRIFVAGTSGLFQPGAEYARAIERLRLAAESELTG